MLASMALRLQVAVSNGPCPSEDHPGTAIMHVGQFSRGKGGYSLAQYRPSAELPNAEYPLMLMTGRVLAQYNACAMTGRTEGLNEIAGRIVH